MSKKVFEFLKIIGFFIFYIFSVIHRNEIEIILNAIKIICFYNIFLNIIFIFKILKTPDEEQKMFVNNSFVLFGIIIFLSVFLS